ncbi:MAG: C25 family cysteine peptidase, partial [Candidatus Sulfotelmatobacter sp.]
HDVTIALNGTTLGDLTFTGQAQGKFTIEVPPGVLQNAANTVTLTAQNGEYDLSLVQSIQITYPHTFQADSDILTFTGQPGEEVKITGFTQPGVTVVDITNPDQPVQLAAQVAPDAASKTTSYSAAVQVPWSTTNPAAPALHTLLALANYRITSVFEIVKNHPTTWHSAQPGIEIVMISPRPFASALKPLLLAHQAQQKTSAVVWIDDLYDEFNFGEHSPVAIRSFLQTAVKAWHTAPRYLLLNGRASLDPRNYLGFGDLDFVPTEIIATTGLMTASDDWFSDFNNTGLPTIATGRLPVSTAAEAALLAGRIATYEGQSTNGPWTAQALMVADVNDTENFTKDSQIAQAQLPSALKATDVFTTTMGAADARQSILDAINSGQLLVNYAGHGSEDEWSGDDIFDSTAASSLANGNALPVFLIMDCLNGFFQDVYEEPLSVALMLAPNGGAVAVLSSSGLNQAAPQTILDKLIVKDALSSPPPALGDAILKAKAGISNLAVRKTYNLFGDPAMQIKVPKAAPSN